MYPRCILTINGTPVSGLFWEKLVRLSVHDHAGGKADSIDFVLEDGPPHGRVPRKDDEIRCWLGYGTAPLASFTFDDFDAALPFDYMGAFRVDDVELECLPWLISVKGKSADLREKAKQHRRRHWDGKTFGDVASEMAREEGLTPQIDAEIGGFKPDGDWFGQENESNLHWLERWADRLHATIARKDGKLVVVKRGAGQKPDGSGMIPLIVTPPQIIKNTCRVHWGQRERHGKVGAEYHDTKSGKRRRESEDSDPDSDAVYTHRHAHGGKAEARKAARGRARFLRSGGLTTSVTIEGNPLVKAGAPMTYAGVRPQVDGLQFSIESTVHSFAKGPSYRTEIRAKGKDGAPTENDGGGAGSGGAAAGGDTGGANIGGAPVLM